MPGPDAMLARNHQAQGNHPSCKQHIAADGQIGVVTIAFIRNEPKLLNVSPFWQGNAFGSIIVALGAAGMAAERGQSSG